ncbi:MAG: DUF2911 domain-containing protein [Flavobacteriaceae bacterium]|mgnify:CR=1 FL=1|jgi:hypothetical protein|nr:DUF2911 domain-containing protein [Flavobacteriaceae bacterium]
MKTTSLFTVFFLFIFSFANAQTASNNRVSPLDTIQTQIEDLNVEITYSRPFLKGREFGKDIVPYGKVWRTGANEATVFEVNQDVLIEGKLLPAGKYSLYTIPDEKETIVIFNKEWNQWGTQYDESKDVLRVIIPTFNAPEPVEQFTIDLDEAGAACMVWGDKLFTFHLNRA